MPRNTTSRRGAVLAIVALCLIPLLSVAAVSLDGGLLLDQRRHAQAVADASALAGATDLYYNYQTGAGADSTGTAKTSALATAAANGCNNGGSSNSVAVNIPPASGLFIGKVGYVEVRVQINATRTFSNLFGTGSVPVVARAVARGQWTPLKAAILALTPTGTGLSGGGNAISVSNAAVIVDSTSGNATSGNGNVSMTAPEFDVSGSSPPDSSHFHGTAVTNSVPTPDPLSYLPPPGTSGLATFAGGKYNKDTTLSPGIYTNGIQASSKVSLTLQAGIYYLQSGGLSVTGQAGIIGSGVMIYNAGTANQDTITLTGTGQTNLSPMTSGVYQGLTFFQNRANTDDVTITGTGNMSITGTLYAPAAQLTVKGNGDTIGSQYIASSVNITGNGALNVNWNQSSTAKTRIIQLVE